ncbi:MAG: homoserine kinase [Pseudomonadota bacterium]
MAVYTEVSDADLTRFLAGYDVGELVSYRGIAEGVENTNYMVTTTTGPLILTLYEKRVAGGDLPFFVGLMEHLASNGVSCPVPLRNKQGDALSTLSNRSAALVTFLDGFWLRAPAPRHCHAVGKALAELHLAGSSFNMQRANALGLAGWQKLQQELTGRLNGINPALEDMITQELTHLERHWPQDLPTGIIHADLFPDNVFFLDDQLSGLIDFYFACQDAFAYDFAIALNAWCFEKDFSFNITKGSALFEGYESVRKFDEAERQALPTLARGAAMRFLLTRCSDWLSTPSDALVKPHNPLDYQRRLQFHQAATSSTDYGHRPG